MSLNFHNSNELLDFVEKWVGFSGPGYDYDARGLLFLLQACLKNMHRFFIDGDFEDLEGIFTEEDKQVLTRLLNAMQQSGNFLESER
ncbi:hypothetical protein [Variovorax sp.]|uniref:hypothetical protein n=1 Tax=Variovorax sp. TaxID=1871043 RepID=UPI003BAAB942